MAQPATLFFFGNVFPAAAVIYVFHAYMAGRWVEKAGERRRRVWREFMDALDLVTRVRATALRIE